MHLMKYSERGLKYKVIIALMQKMETRLIQEASVCHYDTNITILQSKFSDSTCITGSFHFGPIIISF